MNPLGPPRIIDTVGPSAAIVHVRVMTPGVSLSRQQEADLGHRFQRYLLASSASLAGAIGATFRLSDGTLAQIRSTGRQHDILVWPAPSGGEPITIAGYLVTPHDVNEPDGWETESPRAYLELDDEEFPVPPDIELHSDYQAGPVNWFGPDGEILSWDHGGNNRYATNRWDSIVSTDGFTPAVTAAEGVFYKGTKITTSFGVDAVAIFDQWLVAMSGDFLYAVDSPLADIDAALARGEFLDEVDATWTAITVTGSVGSASMCSAWHFKPDGSVAGCAVVYDSYGLATWTFDRAINEALPQAKRYVTLSIVAGAIAAVVSDTAFTTEALGTKVGGVFIESTYTTLSGTFGFPSPTSFGALTFYGKRLWGIDWEADGTEIVITMQRTGTGNWGHSFSAPNQTITMDMDQQWGIFANGDELVSAAYFLPQIAQVLDTSPGGHQTTSQPGSGTYLSEYMTLGQLDARVGIAVVERATLSTASSLTTPTDSTISTLAMDFAVAVETWVDGVLVASTPITFPAADDPTVKIYLDIEQGRFVTGGEGFSMTTPTLTTPRGLPLGLLGIPHWPTAPGHNQENMQEYRFANNIGMGISSVRTPERHQANYPNQVSDLLFRFYGGESGGGSLAMQLTNAFGVDLTTEYFTTYMAMFLPSVIEPPRGLGVREYDPQSFVLATRNTYFNALIDAMVRRRETYLSNPVVGTTPVQIGSVFIYDAGLSTWDETDLLDDVADAVDDEVGAGTVDRPTFAFDPVCTL